MAQQNVSIFIQAFDRATRGFRRVQNSGNQMRNDLERQGAGISRSFMGFGGSMTKSLLGVIAVVGVLVAAFQAAKGVFDQFVSAGIQGNAQMEQFGITLAVTTRDLGKANEMLKEATKFAAETPFEIPEVVEATVRLESYGIKAQEVLRIVGDMAAVTGKPLLQAVEAMADAQTGELERLKEFGITKRQLIEAGLEVNSQGAIKDMTSLNDALLSIMRQRFAGGMLLMSQTFVGMVSNLKDAWGTFVRTLSAPAFEVVKKALQDLLAIINRLKNDGTLDRWAERVGNSIAFVMKAVLLFPKVFNLVIQSFVAFVKRLGDWEFFIRVLQGIGQFIVMTFKDAFRLVLTTTKAFAKIVWNPIVIAWKVAITGIINFFDLLMTAVEAGLALFVNVMVSVLNTVVGMLNKVTEVASKVIPKWDIPPIPDIPTPFDNISNDFDRMGDRMVGRLDELGVVWNERWAETGEIFKEQGGVIVGAWKTFLGQIRDNAEETLFPIFKEGIGDDLLAQWAALSDSLNEEVIPAAIEFNLEQEKTIKKGRELAAETKKQAKARKEFAKQRAEAERALTARLIELTLGETALRIAELRNLRNRYLQLGLDRVQVERLFNLELERINEERLAQFEEISLQIQELTLSDTEFRLNQIERERQAWIQQGADRMEVEQLAALQRAQVQTEADQKIRREGLFTIQTLTSNWGTFLGFARRGFRILRGTSNETWQEMIADMIEWVTSLVAQLLIAKGLEQTRRAEGQRTHAQFMKNNAEELAALAAKFALSGDIVRAAAAGALAAASTVRAVAIEKEASALDNAAKKSIALGVAVQTGGAIASEALQQWGIRAADARKKQEELQRGAEELRLDGRDIDGLVPSTRGGIGRPPDQPIPVEIVRTQGPLEPELTTTALTSFPDVGAAPAAIGADGTGVTFVQNNQFEGLVNFDNEEALRELARKLQPLNEEFEETFVVQSTT